MRHSAPHRLIRLLLVLLFFGGFANSASVEAKTWAQAWIRDGSLPLPPGCDTYELVIPLEQFLMEYNAGDTVSLSRRVPSDRQPLSVAIATPAPYAPTGTAMQTFTAWEQVAAVARQRHTMHDRFVLLQVEVVQNGNPWVDVTFDAFREADDFGGRIVGGTAAVDCTAGKLISLAIGDQERLATIEVPEVAVPDGSPPASACRVGPVPTGRLAGISAAIKGAEWRWATSHAPAEVVGGRLLPRDYPAISSLVVTIEEFLACYNAEDLARAAALFTPDYWRQPPSALVERTARVGIAPLLATLTGGSDWPREPGLRPVISNVSGIRLLEDGRLSAGVTLAGASTAFGQIVIFEQAGDRWLIDAVHNGGLIG